MKKYLQHFKIPLVIVGLTLLALSIFLPAKAVVYSKGDGMLLYAPAGNTTPQTKAFDNGTNGFGPDTATISGAQATIVQMKSSPTKDELIAGYEDASGNLQIMCYNGSKWRNEWQVAVGGTGTTRRFDINYETSTGDAVVAYSTGSSGTNALAYRTKPGTKNCGSGNWSTATNFPTATSVTTGVVQWVKSAHDSRATSSLDAFIWADSNSTLGSAIWDGSGFTNFVQQDTTLENISTAQDIDNFEVQFESISGDIMVVWGDAVGNNGTQGAFYATCNGGTASCTWSTPAKISTGVGDDATNLDLSADPTSNRIAFASIGNAGSDLQAGYWDGSTWAFYPNIGTSTETPTAGTKLVQTGWVTNGANTRWIITYDDASGANLSWFSASPGTTPVVQTDFNTVPNLNDIRERYQIDNNPFDSSQLMLVITDSTNLIVAVRLTIDGSGVLTWENSSSPSGLGSTNTVPTEGVSFQYRRFVPNYNVIISPSKGDGVFVYGKGSDTTPEMKTYDVHSNVFSDNIPTFAGSQPTIVQLKSSPYKNEMIAGYEDASGNLQIMCYNGVSWTNDWSVAVGGTGTTRRFDIAYETSTGDAVVAYSRGTAATNALAYRTKAGSSACGSWSSATNFPTGTTTTTGTVQWVKAARDGRATSALDAFIWADSNSDLGAAVWNGTAPANFKRLSTNLEFITTSQDVDNFEVQYESISGDIMVVWGDASGNNGTMGGYYATCTGGTATCTWTGTPGKIWTQAGDDATNLDLSADPTSDKMAFSSIGNAGSDLQAAYWSGTAWTRYPNRDTSTETPAVGTRLTQTGWVTNGSHTKWIITYDDASGTGLSWYSATPGTAPVKETDFATSPTINDIRQRYQIDNNPYDNSQLMLLISDQTKQVSAERLSIDTSGNLTWTDASPGTGVALINSAPQEDFSFQYRRYVPQILQTDITDSNGSNNIDSTIDMSPLTTSFDCQNSTGAFNSVSQRLFVQNTTTNSPWTLSMAASDGNTALWSDGTHLYDFNDPSGAPAGCSPGLDSDTYAGQLSTDMTSASITPQTNCLATGLTIGSSAGFNEGSVDALTLMSASGSAPTNCYWFLTGVGLKQYVPAEQPAGNYTLDLTITVVAS